MSTDDEKDADWESPDSTFTRVVSRTFEIEGVTFSWWAIDESPALVTVSSQWFGNRAELTEGDPETFARQMATRLLKERTERIERMREQEVQNRGVTLDREEE